MNESDLEQTYTDSIIPWVDHAGIRGSLTGAGGVTLRHLRIECPTESAVLVFMCGYNESFLKYVELFYDLRDAGLSVYCCDMRGQGFSDHLLADPEVAHVEAWEHYVADLKAFVDGVVNARPHRRIFLLAHSLGGAIAALYLARHQPVMNGAILNAPLVRNRFSAPERIMVRVLDLVGRGRARIPAARRMPPRHSRRTRRRTAARVTRSRPR